MTIKFIQNYIVKNLFKDWSENRRVLFNTHTVICYVIIRYNVTSNLDKQPDRNILKII